MDKNYFVVGDRVRRTMKFDALVPVISDILTRIVFIPPEEYVFTISSIKDDQVGLENWFFNYLIFDDGRPGWFIEYFAKAEQ